MKKSTASMTDKEFDAYCKRNGMGGLARLAADRRRRSLQAKIPPEGHNPPSEAQRRSLEAARGQGQHPGEHQ